MTYYLGVDQGSHSSRAVLFDDKGEVVDAAAQQVIAQRYDDGRVEYDANQLLASVAQVIQRVLSSLDPLQMQQVAACGIATQRSTMLAWNSAGETLSHALSWQDVRAASLLERLQPHQAEIRQLTGLPLTPYYSAAKMHWLLHHSAAVMQQAGNTLRLSPLVSYLLYHLLQGRPYVVDYSNAQRTQLFDIASLAWSEHLCQLFDVEKSLLPACRPMCSNYGQLADTAIPVTAVCGDQNAAMFGIGPLQQGEALVNIGSGAFVLRELQRFSISTNLLTGIAYSDDDHVSYMREATVNGAGNALSWAQQEWGIEDLFDRLPEWLDAVQQPPVFINTIGGLGTPWMCSGIDPRFVGNEKFSRAEKVVAVIESIVFMLQVNIELMTEEAPLQCLRVSGGLSQLDGLCQKLCNLSGVAIERSEVGEATARGAAWLAAGCPDSWHNTVRSTDTGCRRFTPQYDEKLDARYRLFKTEVNRISGVRAAGGLEL